jgi:aspartate/methionine/tyrosine aminotransferase
VLFSERLNWESKPNRLTELLAKKHEEDAAVLDLTQSNPTQAGFRYPLDVVRAFEDSSMLTYEPSPRGMHSAREAVSAYYSVRGHEVPPDRILLTASTSEAYSYLFKLLTDPGDTVVVPRPSYPLFEYLAKMESLKVSQYPLHYDNGWSIATAEIPKDARVLALVNPNNPTGSYLKCAELEKLTALGIPIISDEVFSDYSFKHDAARVPTLVGVRDCLTFSMSGLSKIAGLPQMKLGWIVVSGPPELRKQAMEKLEWIADTYLSVGVPVQCALPKLMRFAEEFQRHLRGRTIGNLGFAREILAGSAADVLQVEGGWYATIRMPRVRSEEEYALDLLDRAGVLVQPGYFYDFESEAYLVVSLLTEESQFREGLARIRHLLLLGGGGRLGGLKNRRQDQLRP